MKETELSMERRLGASEHTLLVMQGNIANTYSALGRDEEALSMRHEVYSGHLNLDGEETEDTLLAALNYGDSFLNLRRFEEAKALLRRTMPVARRALGESNETALRMRGFTRWRSTRTPPLRSTVSARPWRRSRTRNGSRGVCSVARTRSQKELRATCEMREPRSAPGEASNAGLLTRPSTARDKDKSK